MISYNDDKNNFTVFPLQNWTGTVVEAVNKHSELYLLKLKVNENVLIEMDFMNVHDFKFDNCKFDDFTFSDTEQQPKEIKRGIMQLVVIPQLTQLEVLHWAEISRKLQMPENTIVMSGRVGYSESGLGLISCGGLCIKIENLKDDDCLIGFTLHQYVSIFVTLN